MGRLSDQRVAADGIRSASTLENEQEIGQSFVKEFLTCNSDNVEIVSARATIVGTPVQPVSNARVPNQNSFCEVNVLNILFSAPTKS